MLGLDVIIGASLKIIDKIIPDPKEKAAAHARLLEMQQSGQLKELEISMSAIIAEAQSVDKWTSRARPSFLYVIYVFILAAIPMGVIFSINPELSRNIAQGVNGWLSSLPEELYWLFGTGYLGYTGARTFDKAKKG